MPHQRSVQSPTFLRACFGLITAFAALFAAVAITACPGSLENKERFLDGGVPPAECPDVPKEILAKKCGGSGCHEGSMPQQNLDLSSPGVETRIVGTRSIECNGVLADPNDPQGSVIYTKVTAENTCAGRMPIGKPLSDEEIACIKAWIATLKPSSGTMGGNAMGAAGTGGMGE